MINFIQYFFFILLTFSFYSCEFSNKPAKGSEDEIIVIADSSDYARIEPLIKSIFEKQIFTPQPEKLFTVKKIALNEIESYQNHKSIIIIGTLESDKSIANFIKALSDTTTLKKAATAGDNNIYIKYDLWAKNQLIAMVVGKDIASLEEELKKQSDNLLHSFQKISDRRLFESIYNDKDEQKDIEGKLLEKYGWLIYVHQDFKLAKDDGKNNIVKFSCKSGNDLHKWIFVHWIDDASPEYLTEDSIRAIRNRITWQLYRPKDDSSFITVSQENYMSGEIDFKGRYAIVTQGIWNLNEKGMEGPFINYTIFDEKTKKIFMLDGSVFAPNHYKRNILQQLDVILQSFMVENEVSDHRREELKEAASK